MNDHSKQTGSDGQPTFTRRDGIKKAAGLAALGLGLAPIVGAGLPSAGANAASTPPAPAQLPSPRRPRRGARGALHHRFGVNHTSINGPLLDSQTVIDFMNQDAPRITRFPAGDEINVWDWRTGWVVDPLPDWQEYFRDKETVYPTTLERLKALMDATGVVPLFALNVATSTLEDQLEMLRHASSLGIPVDYVELGNELYWGRYQVVFATPQDYANLAGTWSAAIKSEFPAAKVAAAANNIYAPFGSTGRYGTWNNVLAATIEASGTIDAVTMHPYIFSQYYPELTDLSPTNLDRLYATSLMSRQSVTETLDTQIPDGIPVWITEWNFLDRTGHTHSRWAHGIYVVSMMLSFLEERRIEISTYWAMLAGMVPTAHHHPTFSPGFVNKFGVTPKPYGLTAAGVGLNAALNAMKGAAYFQSIDLSDHPVITTEVNGETHVYPALVGYEFTGQAGRAAIILNRSSQPISIDVADLFPEYDGAWIHQYSTPSRVVADADLDVTTQSTAIPATAVLQPYSISRFLQS